jgi:protein transport protein SEC20
MRAALLASKRVIDSKASSGREELLCSSLSNHTMTSDGKTTYVTNHMLSNFFSCKRSEDAVMKAQTDVTDTLRRTMGLMQSELERSVLSNQMLG